MGLEITFLGHSGFLFSDGTHTLAVDPFLTGNPLAKHRAEDVSCGYIALTHGHGDHLGDTAAIARRTGATVICAWEIYEFLSKKGLEKFEPGNPGGAIQTPFGSVTFVRADHSSSHDGHYLGNPCGLIIRMGGKTVYHLGDTGLFGDMKLLGEIYQPDIACIPVGDRFTMGPELAARAAEMIGAATAIPIHYATFPMLRQTIDGFSPKGVKVREMKPGQSWIAE